MKSRDEKTSIWTLPNRLSLVRILLIPVIICLISMQNERLRFLSCVLFVVAGITDGLDGLIARRMSMKTRLGVYLDPIADKLLISTVLITLSYYRLVPLWVTIVMVGREFLINGLRSFYAMEGVTIYPSFTGKLKTTLQIVGIACVLFGGPLQMIPLAASPDLVYIFFPLGASRSFHTAGLVIIYISLCFSLYSAYRYICEILTSETTDQPTAV
jgi:CDP-diacylglycerol--glycerol-3-phosphate 3-phosphatidyltransferase